MSMEKNLKEIIEELIQEVEKELDEATTTGNVDGYQTPHAFSRKSDKERRKKNATQLGYTLVDDNVDNIDEAYNGNLSDFKTDIVLALDNVGISPKAIKKISKKGKGFELHMSSYMKNKVLWEKLGKQMGAKLVDFQPGSVNVGLYESVNEGVWTPEQKRQVELLDSQFREYLSKKGIEPTTIEASRAWKSLGFQDKMRKIFPKSKYESVSESKSKRPVNRWLELKNDETMHPHKKMAHGLKELKYQLAETEKFFRWYNQIKTMNELDSTGYWKRTQNHIYKIKERLINIAKTLQEIEK